MPWFLCSKYAIHICPCRATCQFCLAFRYAIWDLSQSVYGYLINWDVSRLTRGVCARRIGSCWCGIAVDRRLYRTALFNDWDCVRDRKEKLCLHALYLNENRIAGFYRVNFCSQANWNGHCTESIILVWVKIADKYVRPIKIYGNPQIHYVHCTWSIQHFIFKHFIG